MAVKVCEYGVGGEETPPASGETVVIVIADAWTVIAKFRVADNALGGAVLSVTRIVKFAVSAVVGVPLIVPPEERVSPAGRLPPVIDHV